MLVIFIRLPYDYLKKFQKLDPTLDPKRHQCKRLHYNQQITWQTNKIQSSGGFRGRWGRLSASPIAGYYLRPIQHNWLRVKVLHPTRHKIS